MAVVACCFVVSTVCAVLGHRADQACRRSQDACNRSQEACNRAREECDRYFLERQKRQEADHAERGFE
jgi:hypothetical protein